MRSADVVVIGGGAAGLIAAREAAKLGLDVKVFEEDLIVGRPERCAGLYSVKGLKALGVPLRGRHVQNEIRGAVIYSPGGAMLEVRTERPVALVLSRESLDRLLAEEVVRAGGEIKTGKRVASAVKDSEGATVKLSGNEYVLAKVLIDAEGHGGFIAKQLFPEYSARDWIPIVQFLIKGHQLERDKVYVWARPYLRDFFGYLVPIDEEIGRIGVASYRSTLEKALKFKEEIFPKSKVIGYVSSSVYAGRPIELGLTGNVLLVGDVAGQAKATTGGGVIIGGLCAMAAARHAASYVEEKDTERYRRETRAIYRELNAIYRLNKLLKRLPDRKLDAFIASVSESGYTESLSKSGEMDFQVSGLLKSLISPSSAKLFFSLLLRGFLF